MILRPLRDALVVLGAATASGCYTYVPVQNPAPATEVRIRLPVTNPAQGSRFVTQTVDIEGRLLSTGDTLVLETTNRVQLSPVRELVGRDTVRVGADQVVTLEEKVFSNGRTIGLLALMVGVVAAAVGGIAATGVGGGEGPPDGSAPADVPAGGLFRALGGVFGR